MQIGVETCRAGKSRFSRKEMLKSVLEKSTGRRARNRNWEYWTGKHWDWRVELFVRYWDWHRYKSRKF